MYNASLICSGVKNLFTVAIKHFVKTRNEGKKKYNITNPIQIFFSNISIRTGLYIFVTMKKDDDILTEVFSGTPWEAEMVKSLLENAEISACIRNSILQSNMYDPIYSSGTKVVVLEADKERATEIVNEYYENLKK